MAEKSPEYLRVLKALATVGIVGTHLEARRRKLADAIIADGDAALVTVDAMKALRAEGKIQGTANIPGWAMSILEAPIDRREYLPQVLDEWRSRQGGMERSVGGAEPGASDRQADQERRDRVPPEVVELQNDRQALALYRGDRKDVGQIAAIMGESEAKVRERLDRHLRIDMEMSLQEYDERRQAGTGKRHFGKRD